MIATIRKQQTAMLDTLNGVEANLIRAGDIDIQEIILIRAKLGAQLRVYTEFKHGHVFPKLLASDDPIVASSAARMQTRCERIGCFYEQYLSKWPVARIAEQQAEYRGVGLDVVGRLRQHFYREAMDVERLTECPKPPPQPALLYRYPVAH